MFKLSFDPEAYRATWISGSGWKFDPTEELVSPFLWTEIPSGYTYAIEKLSSQVIPFIEVVKIRVYFTPSDKGVSYHIQISVTASHKYHREEKVEKSETLDVPEKTSDPCWVKKNVRRVILNLVREAVIRLRNDVHSRNEGLNNAVDCLPQV